MMKAEIIAELGKPLVVRPAADEKNEHWHYVGQFGRLDLEVERNKDDNLGKVVAANWEQTPADYRQDSIRQQKFFAVACALMGVIGTAWLIRIWRTRVVVDETGLTYDRRVIPWEAMTQLDSAQYHAKGWLTLHYQQGQSQRKIKLDSFKIDAFDEVIDAICLQRGFVNPIPIDEPIEETSAAGGEHGPTDEEPR
jgi:hypothetical protein